MKNFKSLYAAVSQLLKMVLVLTGNVTEQGLTLLLSRFFFPDNRHIKADSVLWPGLTECYWGAGFSNVNVTNKQQTLLRQRRRRSEI